LSGRRRNLLHAWNAPAGLVRLHGPARGSGAAWCRQAGQNSHFGRRRAPEPVRGPSQRRAYAERCAGCVAPGCRPDSGRQPVCPLHTREHTSQPNRKTTINWKPFIAAGPGRTVSIRKSAWARETGFVRGVCVTEKDPSKDS